MTCLSYLHAHVSKHCVSAVRRRQSTKLHPIVVDLFKETQTCTLFFVCLLMGPLYMFSICYHALASDRLRSPCCLIGLLVTLTLNVDVFECCIIVTYTTIPSCLSMCRLAPV